MQMTIRGTYKYGVRGAELLQNRFGQDGTKRAEANTVAKRPVTAKKSTNIDWTRCYTEHQRTLWWANALVVLATSLRQFSVNEKFKRQMRVKMDLLYNDGTEQDDTKWAEANTVAELSNPVQKSLHCSSLHDRILRILQYMPLLFASYICPSKENLEHGPTRETTTCEIRPQENCSELRPWDPARAWVAYLLIGWGVKRLLLVGNPFSWQISWRGKGYPFSC
jgi:hypothetical protein